VYEHGTTYVCEHAVGPKQTCDFKTGKIILQQPVAHEQMHKLLSGGRTDLLDGFVSNRTRRKFKAYLRYDPQEGKVVFEFEPRPQRAGKAPPAKGAAANDDAPAAPAKKAAARKSPAQAAPAATRRAAPTKASAPAKAPAKKAARKAGKR